MISSLLSFLLVILSASAPNQQAASAGARTVQIVYESDTRGYYQPCG